jgi:hypothetical protein
VPAAIRGAMSSCFSNPASCHALLSRLVPTHVPAGLPGMSPCGHQGAGQQATTHGHSLWHHQQSRRAHTSSATCCMLCISLSTALATPSHSRSSGSQQTHPSLTPGATGVSQVHCSCLRTTAHTLAAFVASTFRRRGSSAASAMHRDVSPVGRRAYGLGTYSIGYGIGRVLACRSRRRSGGRSTAVTDEDLRSLCRKSRKSSAQNA